MRRLFELSAPALALALVLLVPFLGKAHTIDDVTFLKQAQQVLSDPLHPTAFDLVADGTRIRLSSQMVSGPVMAYLLAPAAALGGSERMAHLVQLVLFLGGLVATVALALRLGATASESRLAGLLLACMPAVTPMVATSMADVPAMVLGVLGIERLVAWRRSRRMYAVLASVVSLACAVLARPHLILLLPVAGLFVWSPWPVAGEESPRPRLWRALLPIVAAVMIAAAVNALTADPGAAGGSFGSRSVSRFAWSRVPPNLLAYLTHWVFALPLALPLLFARRKSIGWWILCAIGLIVSLGLLHRAGLGREWLYGPAAALGLAALAYCVLDAVKRSDGDSLALAGWLLLSLPTAGYDHTPSKYLIASAPAVAIIASRVLNQGRGSTARAIPVLAVVFSALLSTLILLADTQFAGAARDAARTLIAPRVADGEHVWAYGGWGFQWYAEQAGAQTVALEPPVPVAGDVVVACSAFSWVNLERFPSRRQIDERVVHARFGQIMDSSSGAGYYSNSWGLLPWVPRGGELVRFTVWRLE